MTRRAISPRLATRIFLNIVFEREGPLSSRLDREQSLAVLDRLAVLGKHLHDLSGDVRLDLVHELHRLDDAENLVLLDAVSRRSERRRLRRSRAVERSDDRRQNVVKV